MSEFLAEPGPSEDSLRRLGELMLSLRKSGMDVYIDVAVKQGEEPEYEYWETSHKLGTEEFRNGTE